MSRCLSDSEVNTKRKYFGLAKKKKGKKFCCVAVALLGLDELFQPQTRHHVKKNSVIVLGSPALPQLVTSLIRSTTCLSSDAFALRGHLSELSVFEIFPLWAAGGALRNTALAEKILQVSAVLLSAA